MKILDKIKKWLNGELVLSYFLYNEKYYPFIYRDYGEGIKDITKENISLGMCSYDGNPYETTSYNTIEEVEEFCNDYSQRFDNNQHYINFEKVVYSNNKIVLKHYE